MNDTLPDLDAYLARIGYAGPRDPGFETLAGIVRAHVGAIAFENLDPLRAVTVGLDPASLHAKLVAGGRGGYCYEHNLLLGNALRGLGYPVRNLAARVMRGVPRGQTRPRTHMLMAVTIDGERWLVDVGFGGLTLTEPVRLDPAAPPQSTAVGRFRLQRHGDGEDAVHDLLVEAGSTWRPLYAFDLQAQQRVDYELTSWYLCHHADSPFRKGLMAARVVDDGRYALLDNRLSRYPPGGGEAQVSTLRDGAALRSTLETVFLLDLSGIDGIDALLAAIAGRANG